jgi:hypothetical protein
MPFGYLIWCCCGRGRTASGQTPSQLMLSCCNRSTSRHPIKEAHSPNRSLKIQQPLRPPGLHSRIIETHISRLTHVALGPPVHDRHLVVIERHVRRDRVVSAHRGGLRVVLAGADVLDGEPLDLEVLLQDLWVCVGVGASFCMEVGGWACVSRMSAWGACARGGGAPARGGRAPAGPTRMGGRSGCCRSPSWRCAIAGSSRARSGA